MGWYKNLNMPVKLALMFGTAAVPFIVMCGLAYFGSVGLTARTEKILDVWLPGIIYIDDLNISAGNFRINEYKYVMTDDPREQLVIESEMKNIHKRILENIKRYRTLPKSRAENKIFQEFLDVHKRYSMVGSKIFWASKQNQGNTAKKLLAGESQTLFHRQNLLLKQLVHINQAQAVQSANRVHSTQVSAAMFYSTIPILVLVLILLAFLLMEKSIVVSLKRLETAARELATYKTFTPIKVISTDEIGSISSSFNEMGKDITNAIRELKGQREA